MKMPAQISPWMNSDDMARWVREAPTIDALKKRLSIWMTLRGPLHAHRVADLLQVSKQAVWLWIKQFNEGGPDSLDRKGRGGRRRAYLSMDDERLLVSKLQELIANGQARKAKELLPEVLKTVGQSVSVAYVYRLMQRHERKRGLRALVNGSGRKDREDGEEGFFEGDEEGFEGSALAALLMGDNESLKESKPLNSGNEDWNGEVASKQAAPIWGSREKDEG